MAEFKVPFPSTKCIVLATNNHVLQDVDLALQSEIVFDTGQQGHTFTGKELFNTEIWKSSDARVCGSFRKLFTYILEHILGNCIID